MRQRLIENGMQITLSSLVDKIAWAMETLEHGREREKAVAAATEVNTNTDVEVSGKCYRDGETPNGVDRPICSDEFGQSVELQVASEGGNDYADARATLELREGYELDDLAASCLGALSTILRSDEAKNALMEPGNRALEAILKLATVPQGRCEEEVLDISRPVPSLGSKNQSLSEKERIGHSGTDTRVAKLCL